MSIADEITEMLSEIIGQHFVVEADADLFGALRLEGDDATEFLEEYAARYNVDMADFLWYFHYNADEPPQGRRVLPVLPNGSVAPYEPITLTYLVNAAQAGRWVWSYPEHRIRLNRFYWLTAPIIICAVAVVVLALALY